MGLYDYDFCHGLVYKSWDAGIINNLKDAREAILKNFQDMDLENASVREHMQDEIRGMVREIDQLIQYLESVHFS